MTQFMQKSFSVGMNLGEQGRKNWERIFRKPRRRRKGETNDTARVQEAIDRAAKDGSGVYIPSGAYKFVALKPPKKKAAK